VASLGSFGAAIREYEPDGAERDTFEFCGETFTVEDLIPSMLELHVAAGLLGKVSGVEGDAAVFEALRCALTIPARDGGEPDESQWQRFYALALDKRADGRWLTAIALNIMGAQAGRPTEQRPTSSSGPLPTSTSSSTSVSDSPDSPRLRPVDEVLGG
jgi:hypothetical protein